MSFRDILVHLDGSPRSSVRLGLAAKLAAQHGAHLTGLYVIDVPPADMFTGFPSAFFDLQRAEELISRMRASATADAERVATAFRQRIERDGVRGEWRLVEGLAGETVALHGRYADLVVVGQSEPRAGRAVDLPAGALLGCGRPLLMVPYAGTFDVLGEIVLVAWNGSAEAARAVNEALPLLRRARKVIVLAINPSRGIRGEGDLPAADMALHLARHDIRAEAAHTLSGEIPEGETLLSYAADVGADLLVCGMYGHPRIRETIFGGVTQTLLREMTVPVFLAR
jgi:nucleotide-binding universal stress UspA family protein